MFQDSVPAGSYNDPFLSSVCMCVCACKYEKVQVGRVELCFGRMSDKHRL